MIKYKKTKLKNGLRVITAPMHETETVTAIILVGVGSRYETERESGLSHFIEHMLFKGTRKRPTAMHITEELDSIGGEYNAFTGKERTGYYVKVDAKHLDKALDVVSDIYLNAKLEAREIKKEKGAICQEIDMYEDMPMRKIDDEFESLLYGATPLGRDIGGTKAGVNSFRRPDFVRFMDETYRPENTLVCVAGKFDEARILGRIRKYFAGMPDGPARQCESAVGKQSQPGLRIKRKKTDQTHLMLGVRAYDFNHKDRFALGILGVILGGNMSSRMFNAIREKRGLAYHVSTSVEQYKDVGYLVTSAGVEHKNLNKTIELILKEYKKASRVPVGAKELKKAKDYIKGKSVMHLEASDEVAMFLADQEMKRSRILMIDDVCAEIDKVTAKDLQRIAREIFRSDRLNLAVIGPHDSSVAIRKSLNKL